MSDKIDFKKEMKPLYAPTRSKGIHLIDVPVLRYLMVDGVGDPNSAIAYGQAVETLYAVAYGLKFASRIELERDYVVPPLEGLWWADDLDDFIARRKHNWKWTMMIMVPEWIGPRMIDTAMAEVKRKKSPPALNALRVELLQEGRVAQVLHIGPYDEEGAILAHLHDDFLPAHGLRPTGKHHEIYLSDPRKSAPANLRTVLRQPVKQA